MTACFHPSDDDAVVDGCSGLFIITYTSFCVYIYTLVCVCGVWYDESSLLTP